MKIPQCLKGIRMRLGSAALAVLPDHRRRVEAERKERKALIKYVKQTTPEEHVGRVKKLV